MFGEVHAPALATDVCVVLSLLRKLTVAPMARVMGLGENAVVVKLDAPLTMLIVVEPAGAGSGDAGLLPQAAKPMARSISTTRRCMIGVPPRSPHHGKPQMPTARTQRWDAMAAWNL